MPTSGASTSEASHEQEKRRQLQFIHSQAENSFNNLNINLLRDFYKVYSWQGCGPCLRSMALLPENIGLDDYIKRSRIEIAAGVYNICREASGDVSFHLNINELITLYAYFKGAVEISHGVHEGFGINNGVVKRFLEQPQSQPTHVPQNTFPYFNSFPREVRDMIWKEAVRTQDRLVWIDGLRKITKAPCPNLFLVNHEAKQAAQDVYQKVRGGDILTGRIMPSYYAWEGPIISFEHDIIMIENWYRWTKSRHSMTSRNAHNRLLAGRPLRPMQKRIAEMGELGISRVAFKQNELCYNMPEMVYFKNARRFYTVIDPATDERDEWAWAWTEGIEEVYILYQTPVRGRPDCREHLSRMFPPLPNTDCICSLCTLSRRPGASKRYEKPEPQDVVGHEDIFDVEEARAWLPENVPPPALPYQLNPINYHEWWQYYLTYVIPGLGRVYHGRP
ncbi:hypothetical protein F5Y04DRAFT_275002 [Hypomontagnella monticulosa]|nr:hypothetical protein F5Y04DRAFT_275002 [Hypomontagnella monticulosa]